MLRETRHHALAQRQIFQRGVRLTQCRPVLKPPGHEKRLTVLFLSERNAALARNRAETELLVDLLNARDAGKLKARFPRMLEKLNRPRPDHRVIRNLPRRLQISLQPSVRHELHIAEIGETLAAHRVRRAVAFEGQIQTREVAHTVRILRARQPPHRDLTRIPGVLLCVIVQACPNPRRRGRTLRIRGLRHLGRRHPLLLQHRRDFLPLREVIAHRNRRQHLLQIDACRGGLTVALHTVLPQRGGSRRGRGVHMRIGSRSALRAV